MKFLSGARSHKQSVAAKVWTIQTMPGRPVNVSVCVYMPDKKLHQCLPEDVIVDPVAGLVEIIFPYPQTGEARLS